MSGGKNDGNDFAWMEVTRLERLRWKTDWSGVAAEVDCWAASSTLQEAEEWRRSPAFNRAEVNITKVEEAEGVLAILSQWIELDAIDEGVRLDSEIVSDSLRSCAYECADIS
jgi:PRMT5 TIM barrel domain